MLFMPLKNINILIVIYILLMHFKSLLHNFVCLFVHPSIHLSVSHILHFYFYFFFLLFDLTAPAQIVL